MNPSVCAVLPTQHSDSLAHTEDIKEEVSPQKSDCNPSSDTMDSSNGEFSSSTPATTTKTAKFYGGVVARVGLMYALWTGANFCYTVALQFLSAGGCCNADPVPIVTTANRVSWVDEYIYNAKSECIQKYVHTHVHPVGIVTTCTHTYTL